MALHHAWVQTTYNVPCSWRSAVSCSYIYYVAHPLLSSVNIYPCPFSGLQPRHAERGVVLYRRFHSGVICSFKFVVRTYSMLSYSKFNIQAQFQSQSCKAFLSNLSFRSATQTFCCSQHHKPLPFCLSMDDYGHVQTLGNNTHASFLKNTHTHKHITTENFSCSVQ